MRRLIAISTLVTLAGCTGGDGAAAPSGTKAEKPAPTAAAAPAEPAAPATTDGEITATIGGEALTFSHLPADANFILKLNFGIQGSTAPEGGATLQIMSTAPFPTEGPFPATVESESSEAYFEHHKKVMAGEAERRLQRNINLIYDQADGTGWFGPVVLEVTSFDAGRLVGTFKATLRSKKKEGGDPKEATGKIDVVMKTPAAGRVVEEAVTGK